MARVGELTRRATRRIKALPGRARVALAAAVVLSVVAVLLLAWPGGDGDDGTANDTAPAGDAPATSSTTLATGGLDIEAPEGWQEIPVPDLRVGLAVPPGWEATLLSSEALGALANASPVVPDFAENAHAAARAAGVLYAAGEDQAGGVSDLTVRAAPQPGVTDAAGLEEYAAGLAAEAGRSDAVVEVVEGTERPTVRLRFRLGAGDEVAEGTETLVLGPDGFVWSLTVTSDDPAIHDDLVDSLVGTLTFSDG